MSDLTLKRKAEDEIKNESKPTELKKEDAKFTSLTFNQKLIIMAKGMRKEACKTTTACDNLIDHLHQVEYEQTPFQAPSNKRYKQHRRYINHPVFNEMFNRIFADVSTYKMEEYMERFYDVNNIQLSLDDVEYLKDENI